jgi:hypothetical protein
MRFKAKQILLQSISNYGRLSYQQQTIVQNPMVSSWFHAFARSSHFVLLRAVAGLRSLTVILENGLLRQSDSL